MAIHRRFDLKKFQVFQLKKRLLRRFFLLPISRSYRELLADVYCFSRVLSLFEGELMPIQQLYH